MKNLRLLSHINKNNNHFMYSFSFITLLPPSTKPVTKQNNNITSKLVTTPFLTVKRSYLIVAWLHYLQNSIKGQLSNSKKKNKIFFAFLPTEKKKYTITKAPMAHKTYSKEQIQFRYFKLKISFKAYLAD